MPTVKIKILSEGKIPGYITSGPVLNPMEVDYMEALKFITMGLDVRVYNKKSKEYRKYNLNDMMDLMNDKEEVEPVKYYETDTTGGNLELQQISQEQVQSTPSSDVHKQYDRHTSEVNSDDKPYFGDAYEAPPIEAFGLDDFEEK